MRKTSLFTLSLVLSIGLLAACGNDGRSGGTGGGEGEGEGEGSTSAGDCPARCQQIAAECGIDPASCDQLCASVTEKDLGCMERAHCDNDAYQTCLQGGGEGEGEGGGEGEGEGGGEGEGEGSGEGEGEGGGEGEGEGGGSADCEGSGLIPGQCEDKSGTSLDAICADFEAQPKPFRCCSLSEKEGCVKTTTAANHVTLFCCP